MNGVIRRVGDRRRRAEVMGSGEGAGGCVPPRMEVPEQERAAHTAVIAGLRAQLSQLDLALGAIEDGIVWTDREGRVEWCNAAFDALAGRPHAEVMGALLECLLPLRAQGQDLAPGAHPVRAALLSPRGVTGVYDFRQGETTRSLEIYSTGVHFRKHSARAVLVIRDVTGRRKAEEKFRGLLESAPDAMVIADAQGRIALVNSQTEKLFGYTREEMVGRPVEMLMPESFRARHVAQREGYVAAPRVRPMGAGLDLFARRKDGTSFPVEISLSPLETEEGMLAMADIRDVTERKRAEKALHLVEERFRVLVQDVKDYAIFMIDPAGNVTTWNDGAQRLKGYSHREIVGRNFSCFYPAEEAAGGKPARLLETAAGAGRAEDEGWRVRKDGTRFWAAVAITALKDEQGALYGYANVTRDMTEQRRREDDLRQAKDEAEAAYRELEVFSYSVAHDLRAPLRKIDGFALAVLEEFSGSMTEAGKNYLHRMRAASQNMGLLIDSLLKLASLARGEVVRRPMDLSATAESVAAALRDSAPDRPVEFVIQPGLKASGEPGLMRDVLENLMGNAWKFTGKHPSARIEFGAAVSEGQTAYFVRDDGAGFDPIYAGKLFAPFQRLHGVTEFPGTGIGLAVVARIVRLHGGRVWAEGEVEKGAAFRFTLGPSGGGHA